MELAGTGTVRQNRLNKVPVKKKATLEKKNIPRGTSDVVYREDAVLVGWKDSKAVYCASNKYKGTSKSTCSRYNRLERKYTEVQIPECIQAYNAGMGGVDVMDKMVAGYRPKYHIKKCWWPTYSWSIGLAAFQAWRLKCKATKTKEPYLSILQELTAGLFAKYGLETKLSQPAHISLVPRFLKDLTRLEDKTPPGSLYDEW